MEEVENNKEFKYKKCKRRVSSKKNIDRQSISVSSPLRVLLAHGCAGILVPPEEFKIRPKNYKKIKKIWDDYRKTLNVSY